MDSGRKRRKSAVGEVRGPDFWLSYSFLASAARVVLELRLVPVKREVLTVTRC